MNRPFPNGLVKIFLAMVPPVVTLPVVTLVVTMVMALGVFPRPAGAQITPQNPPAAQTPAAAATQAGASQKVQAVEFRGNRRVPAATMRARIFTQPGDAFDEAALRRDFMALYNTGLFDDIVLNVEDGETGKLITFEVKERPNIRSIEYKGNTSVTTSDILDRFRDRKVGLTVESRFEPTRIKRAEQVLKDLLAERGRQMATINVESRPIPPSSVALTFNINEGPKVKVGDISFEGNSIIGRGTLVRSMRHSRPIGIPYSVFLTSIFAKTYDKNKLDEDLEMVRGAYQDRGYFKVLVNDPATSTRTTGGSALSGLPWYGKLVFPPALFFGKTGQKVDIKIPLVEGEQYRLGTVSFKNSTLFREADTALRPMFAMTEGDIFNVSEIRKGLENLRKLYGEFGYINFVASPDTEINEQNKLINMTFNLEEGKQFVVRRIEFSGNTTTRDKVIRRELMVEEGSLFNSRLWENSMLRLNQLDYFDKLEPGKDSNIQTNNNAGTVDIAVTVKEKGKNAINFSGGVSGLSGSFVGFGYQTNNFLGLGETLTFDAQLGSLDRNVVVGLTHPYLFDRPLQVGWTVFSRRYNFDEAQQASVLSGQDIRPIFDLLGADNIQNYRQSSTGITAFASYPLRGSFSRLGFSYGYDTSKVTTFSTVSQRLFEDLNFNGFGGTDQLQGIRTSKITPTYTYNTVDHPLTPSRGTSLFGSLELAGLGGNVRMYRPAADIKHFRPFGGGGRTLGFHLSASTMNGFKGRVLPPFTRFYAGGENDVRGFDSFTIGPVAFLPDTTFMAVLNADGTPRIGTGTSNIGLEERVAQTVQVPVNRITFPGGDTKVIGNFEYRIPIFGPVSLAAFADAGINMAWHRNQLELTSQRLTELTNLFPSSDFKRIVDLAADTNGQWRASTGLELQVIMPIVNAPFRVYWAYNPLRLNTNITPQPLIDRALFPNSATYQSAIQQFASPRGYSEPASTFKFTIGRTF